MCNVLACVLAVWKRAVKLLRGLKKGQLAQNVNQLACLLLISWISLPKRRITMDDMVLPLLTDTGCQGGHLLNTSHACQAWLCLSRTDSGIAQSRVVSRRLWLQSADVAITCSVSTGMQVEAGSSGETAKVRPLELSRAMAHIAYLSAQAKTSSGNGLLSVPQGQEEPSLRTQWSADDVDFAS